MSTKRLILLVSVLIGLNGAIEAQQKYAVLITGDNNAANVPVSDQWNQGQGMGQYGYDEFWNDCFLFWEMLYTEKGYSDENIFVLFANGSDLSFQQQDNRYNALESYGFNITDQSATRAHIQTLFTSTLASLVTQDDFLYVWVMSHGGNTNSDNTGDAYFYASDGQKVFDYELANWIGNVEANKRVIQISVPGANGFTNELARDDINVFLDDRSSL